MENSVQKFEYECLLNLYNRTADYIASIKNRQWQMMVYVSAIAAVLIAYQEKLCDANFDLICGWGFIQVAYAVGSVGIYLLIIDYYRSLYRERKILHNIYNQLPESFNRARAPKGDVRTMSFGDYFIGVGYFLFVVTLNWIVIAAYK